MRHRQWLTTLSGTIALCLLASSTWAQGLLRDSSFSTPAGPPWQGAWRAAGQAADLFSISDADGFTGSESLHYAADTDAAAPGTYIHQDVTCTPNTDYLLTGASKSDGSCAPAVVIYAPGLEAEVTRLQGSTAEQWRRQTLTFNSGAADRLQIRIYGDAAMIRGNRPKTGRAWLDDVQLYSAAEAPENLRPKSLFTPPGDNIARGKPYTLKPNPNYALCSDPDDTVQLTDGIYTVGYFWTQKSTVGWSKGMPVIITVDLGQVEPISGVAFNTAAGRASVTWPEALLVLVSEDGATWHEAGDLLSLSLVRGTPPTDSYAIHRFATDALRTRGRYVQFVVAQTPYCFVDEVEVYRGDAAWLDGDLPGRQITDTEAFFLDTKVHSSLLWRLHADLANLAERIETAGLSAGEQAALKRRVAQLERRIDALPDTVPPDFRTVLPLNEVHAAILALNAPLLRQAGLSGLTAWKTNRWDPLDISAAPPEHAAPATLDIVMMRGEVRGDAVNITNPGDTDVDVLLALEGLPGGTNPEYLQLRDVLFTDTASRTPIAAALPLARRHADGALVTVPAGTTKQIWLSAYRPGALPAGDHRGTLNISAMSGNGRLTIPVRFHLVDLQFPSQPTLSVGGWDYTQGNAAYYGAPGNVDATLALLRDHYVDSPWATNSVQPRGGTYGPDGALMDPAELDFSNWDAWVERWQGARNYCVFLSVGGAFNKEPMGTARFNRMLGDWVSAWVSHMTEQGLQARQLSLLLVDEPHSEAQDRTILTWALPIRQAQPEVVIWEDPTWRDPSKGLAEMFAACTVLCPNTPMMLAQGPAFLDFYREQQAQGRTLWLYSCSGPGKRLDPYAYHRAQKWRAFEIGALGSCYWAFGCGGRLGNSWNAYAQTGVEYSPYFVGQQSVTEGKHMEAIREGVQDYEYLVMLRQSVAAREARNAPHPRLAEAKNLLSEGPKRVNQGIVSGNLQWNVDKDRSVMDEVRIQALELLAELTRQ